MRKKRRILGRSLARFLDDDELSEVHGSREAAPQEPDYTSTKDPLTGEEID